MDRGRNCHCPDRPFAGTVGRILLASSDLDNDVLSSIVFCFIMSPNVNALTMERLGLNKHSHGIACKDWLLIIYPFFHNTPFLFCERFLTL